MLYFDIHFKPIGLVNEQATYNTLFYEKKENLFY